MHCDSGINAPELNHRTLTPYLDSLEDARTYFERWLAWQGNPRLKVGEVKEKDADSIGVDIVTKDNSLVQRFVVNRHNGYFQPSSED